MDWVAIGKMIAPLAPTIGGIVGGLLPIPAGSFIGKQAGQILADALGVDNDPGAIASAITNDPSASEKIEAAEREASSKWQGLADMAKAYYEANSAQAAEINSTMRSELASGQKWYAWRNIYGYSVSIEVAAVSSLFFTSILFFPETFKRFMDASSWLMAWYTLRFGLLGYIHNQSTQEKVAAVTGQQPDGVIKSLAKAIRNK